MKKSLIVIDYQNDFICDTGTLFIGDDGKKLENIISQKIDDYIKKNRQVFFTLDTHFKKNWESHPESKNFKLHCEKGTFGHQLYSSIQQKASFKQCVFYEKNTFAPPEYAIKHIIENSEHIELLGVVTHICVFQTAIALYNKATLLEKNIKFSLFEKGCADFDKKKHDFAVDYMKNILNFEIK